jgi:hypothetical protein
MAVGLMCTTFKKLIEFNYYSMNYDMPDGISYDVFTGIWVSASVLLIFYYPIIIVLKHFPFLLEKKKTCNL